MTVVLDLANGNTETFTTENYVISRPKDFHPMICRVTVFDNGRRIARKKRSFSWWYKMVTFNSFKVQEKLKALQQ
mgnify:CR=1 FL=1